MNLQPNHLTRLALIALLLIAPVNASAKTGRALTILVLIVDSLSADEVFGETSSMPQLRALAEQGVRIESSQGVYPPETLPNHAAILTGQYPENNGIPTSTFWDRKTSGPARALSLPAELNAPTLFRRIADACPELNTAAVISHGSTRDLISECGRDEGHCGLHSLQPQIFFDPAAQPSYQPDVGRTTDVVTIGYARNYLNHADVMVMNLGDADRVTRLDLVSPSSKTLARETALADTDARIGQLVADLEKIGRWESTLLFVISDRGVETPRDHVIVPLAGVLETLGAERFQIVMQGDRASVYLKDRNDPSAWIAAREMAETLAHQAGVEHVYFTGLHNALTAGLTNEQIAAYLLPAALHARHEHLGDLLITPAEGYRFAVAGTKLPPGGTIHGYPSNQNNTLLVLGGVDFLNQGTTIAQAQSIDLTPTIAWLLGAPLAEQQSVQNKDGSLKHDADGQRMMRRTPHYDGRPLAEAFTLSSAPKSGSCGALP